MKKIDKKLTQIFNSTMIQVICSTNLDDYRLEKWPDEFCCPPVIGQKVRSYRGKELTIVGITHTFGSKLLIELHKKTELS